MADLANLLEQSRQLMNQTSKPGFVVTRSLDELNKESKKVLLFFFFFRTVFLSFSFLFFNLPHLQLMTKAGVDGVTASMDTKA